MKYKTGRRVLKCAIFSAVISATAFAGDATTIGTIASKITGSFKAIGELIFGIAYVAGLGFGVAAIFKFKQHKDNPTQVPIGTPIALIAISSALVFLPSFYNPLGQTMGIEGGGAGGFTGAGVSNLPGADAAGGDAEAKAD